MTLLNSLTKKILEEIRKPKSYRKGEEFEDYVRNYLFPKENYKLLHKSHGYNTNKEDYVESSLLPDYLLKCKKTGKNFFVEAKYQTNPSYYKNKIEWCKPYQLRRYKELDKEHKVFIILGFGGSPNVPQELFLFPLSSGKFCGLYDSFLDKYEYKFLDEQVFPDTLWGLK